MLPSRLRRRLDRERRIRRAIRRANWGWAYSAHSRDLRRAVLGRFAETPKRCSCWLCSLARRYYGPTRQEKLSLLVMREQIAEWESDADRASPLAYECPPACSCPDCSLPNSYVDWEYAIV